MFIKISVKTSSSNPGIEKLKDGGFLICVSSSPENNKANVEIISILSKHLKISWKDIKIKSGLRSKNKLVEIKTDKTTLL